MLDEIKLQNELLKEIEEERGFSWGKFVRIVKLCALCNEMN